MPNHAKEPGIINPFTLQSIKILWPQIQTPTTRNYGRFAKKSRSIHASFEIQSNTVVSGNSMNGAHYSNGEPIKITFLRRGIPKGYSNEAPEYPIKPPERINIASLPISKELKNAFWISSLELDHFGHTLTETASSLFPLLAWQQAGFDLSQINVVITENFKNEKSIHLLSTLLPTLTPSKIHIVRKDESISIKKLFIPHPTMIIRESVSKGQIWATRAMAKTLTHSSELINTRQRENIPANMRESTPVDLSEQKNTKPAKLWLSRKNISHRRFLEEQKLEQTLISHGWHIFHPEEHSLRAQLGALKKAKVIAGTMSSSFHLLMALSKKNTSKSVYMLAANHMQTVTYFEQFKQQGFRFTIDNCLEYSMTSNNQLKLRDGRSIEALNASINSFALSAF